MTGSTAFSTRRSLAPCPAHAEDASFLADDPAACPEHLLSQGQKGMAGLRGARCGHEGSTEGQLEPGALPRALQESNRELWYCHYGRELAVPVQWSAWVGEGPEHCGWVLRAGRCSVGPGWVAVGDLEQGVFKDLGDLG